MRLSTARDEIEPLRDPRITGPDDPYLTILVIGRVITELGTLDQVTDRDVEGFFAADLAFLQDLYGIINFGDPADVEALQRAVLPVDDSYDDEADNDNDVDVDVDVVEAVEVVDAAPPAAKSSTGSSKRRAHIEEISPQRTP